MPVGIAAIVLTALFVPESRAPGRAASTRSASCWSSLTLASLTYGIIEGPAAGWTSAADPRRCSRLPRSRSPA